MKTDLMASVPPALARHSKTADCKANVLPTLARHSKTADLEPKVPPTLARHSRTADLKASVPPTGQAQQNRRSEGQRAPNGPGLGARKGSKCAVLLCRARLGAQEELQMCCFAVPGLAWGPGRASNVLFCCAGLGLGPRRVPNVLFCCAGLCLGAAKGSNVLFCCSRLASGATRSSKCAVLLCRAALRSQDEPRMCCFAVPGCL